MGDPPLSHSLLSDGRWWHHWVGEHGHGEEVTRAFGSLRRGERERGREGEVRLEEVER